MVDDVIRAAEDLRGEILTAFQIIKDMGDRDALGFINSARAYINDFMDDLDDWGGGRMGDARNTPYAPQQGVNVSYRSDIELLSKVWNMAMHAIDPLVDESRELGSMKKRIDIAWRDITDLIGEARKQNRKSSPIPRSGRTAGAGDGEVRRRLFCAELILKDALHRDGENKVLQESLGTVRAVVKMLGMNPAHPDIPSALEKAVMAIDFVTSDESVPPSHKESLSACRSAVADAWILSG